MISDEATDKLNALDVALFGERYRGILDSGSAPFDVSRPNFHDNKADFLKELMTVQAVLNHCDGVLNTIAVYDEELSSENVPAKFSLAIAINVSGLQDRARKPLSTSSDLILRNIIDTGLQSNFLEVTKLAARAYRERFQELKRQEELYWSVAHRPPNYYARTIALRFAKHFGKLRGEKPTFGTSSIGNHPSTDYGRALEEVFEILTIKADVRKAAEWALSELKEDDWLPPQPKGLAIMLGAVSRGDSE